MAIPVLNRKSFHKHHAYATIRPINNNDLNDPFKIENTRFANLLLVITDIADHTQ
ncbi:hypothetical protein ACR780_09115 [Sphingobacterium faecium]|uniref:hypothetical protein n=1 Tax=Sphingobacterium faecium TaxID=34087 RepID=UPI003DA60683